MYTQCPDCGTSFRVTAVVLKQAAGKVRCGGCSNAFNALAYLSEAKPDPSVRTEADGTLPELTPETIATSSDAPPTAISPEQSAALLKTLDQLAGEDIRLEDTGIEWRVMSDDDESIDEVLDRTPTEVDEFLTKTPTEVEAGEIFDDPKPSQVESVEVFEGADERPTQTRAEELRFDDNTGLPDDFNFDDVPVAPTKPEPEPEPDSDPDPDPDPESSQVDLAFGDAADWGDLLDEVEDEPEPEPEPENEFGEELDERIAAEELEASANQPPDIDTQFGLQAEAMGIDLSGMHETVEEEATEDDASFPDSTGALEFELKKAQSAAEQLEADLEDFAEEQATQDEKEHAPEEVDVDETPEEIEIDLVEDLDTEEPIADINKFDEKIESLEIRLDDEIDDEVDHEHEHVVPLPTEAEQTVNMQIDQDLFDLAIEDEDGFASTIVIENKKNFEDEILEESSPRHAKDKEREAAAVEKLKDTGSGFETIIMEGEAIRSAVEQEALDADEATGTEPKPKFVLPQEVIEEEPSRNKKYGMIAGAVVLVVLLAAQIVHQSRAEIAQVPALNNVIAPLYRAIGAPITPSWDVSGWRVEVTKGSTNPIAEFVDGKPVVADADVETIDDTAGIVGGEDETLTIYSRIGNKSEKPLPYPLISISLLDRFDSVIGNQVLEPSRYLTGDFDPRVPVSPGETFNAVISIESPSADAAGFKVQVCYRQSAELLRCAIEAYK